MKEMHVKQKVLIYVFAFLLFILTPFALTMMITGKIETQVSDSLIETRRINVKFKNGSQAMDISKFMIGVLAVRLEFSQEIEVLKAESIMVRTDIYRLMGDAMEIDSNKLGMNFYSEKEMKTRWGDSYQDNYNLIADCISATSGKIISSNEKLISAEYTEVSAGKTRDAKELRGEDFAYLAAVECSDDIQSEKYLEVKTFNNEDFAKAFKDIYKGHETQKFNVMETVQIVSRCSAEYVTKVQVGNEIMTGDEFAGALGLNSSCFYAESFNGNGIKITTKGKGTGYGVSIYSADNMAKNGSSCDEILMHFYSNINFINE